MNKEEIVRLVAAIIVFGGWGFATAEFKIFPYQAYEQAKLGYQEIRLALGLDFPWYIHRTETQVKAVVYDRAAIQPGLTLVSGIGGSRAPEARIVDVDGETLHHWNLDWFKLWPEAQHVPESALPKSRPGTHIHGIKMQQNGDLVFNFERLGLVRVDFCGDVIWRLPRRTHHSLFQDVDGNFWVSEVTFRAEKSKALPAYEPTFKDPGILKVSPSGEVLDEWRIFDILKHNNLLSLLYTTTRANGNTTVWGDTLHMNDVKVFADDLREGAFRAGDVMVSLRNLNAVLVFDSDFEQFRHMFIGPFVRQHDPDFIDGDSIRLFDNYTHTADSEKPRSRLITLTVNSTEEQVLFEGSEVQPFFTNIMGKQQRLSNGNYLLTEARQGRAIEIDADGRIVWEYNNLIGSGLGGLIDEAQRLGAGFDKKFIEQAQQRCEQHR